MNDHPKASEAGLSYQALTDTAKSLVEARKTENRNIIAAYSDGSFAREDMVYGSDVDIGFVVKDGHGQKKIFREIIQGVLFEWGFFEQKEYENIEWRLNSSAGLCRRRSPICDLRCLLRN